MAFQTYELALPQQEILSHQVESFRKEHGLPQELDPAIDVQGNIVDQEMFNSSIEGFFYGLMEVFKSHHNLIVAANGALPILERFIDFLKQSNFTDWDNIHIIYAVKPTIIETGEEAFYNRNEVAYSLSENETNDYPCIMLDDLVEKVGTGRSVAKKLRASKYNFGGNFLGIYAPANKFDSKEVQGISDANLIFHRQMLSYMKLWLLGFGLDGGVFGKTQLDKKTKDMLNTYERFLGMVYAKRKDSPIPVESMSPEQLSECVENYIDFISRNSIYSHTDAPLEELSIFRLVLDMDDGIPEHLLNMNIGEDLLRANYPESEESTEQLRMNFISELNLKRKFHLMKTHFGEKIDEIKKKQALPAQAAKGEA